jgi:Ca2+-binding RTX toxin-like protein
MSGSLVNNDRYQVARYNFIRRYEAYVPALYFDTRGFLTTGVGYLLARGYAKPAEKLSQPVEQTSMVTAVNNSVGGLDSNQRRVVDLTTQAIEKVQSENPNYAFSSYSFISQFLASPYGQELNKTLVIEWSNAYRTFIVTGIKEGNGDTTAVAPVFSNESQNYQAFAVKAREFEAVVDRALLHYEYEPSLEERVALFSAAWNLRSSADRIVRALDSGANDVDLRAKLTAGRPSEAQQRYNAEMSLLHEDTSAVPGFDPATNQIVSRIPGAGISPPQIYRTSQTSRPDGSHSYEWEVKADSPNGTLKEGDLVRITYNKDVVDGSNFSSQIVWHPDGSVSIVERSADNKSETYSIWNKDGEVANRVTVDRQSGNVLGDIVVDGQLYRSDGTPIIEPNSTVPAPPPIDPAQVGHGGVVVANEDEAKATVNTAFSNANYGLGQFDANALPPSALGFVPAGGGDRIISDLEAKGYTVTQDESTITATKGDEYFVFGDGYVEIGRGELHGRIDLVNQTAAVQQLDANNVYTIKSYDIPSNTLLSTTTIQQFDDGSALESTIYPDGKVLTTITDVDGDITSQVEKPADATHNLMQTLGTVGDALSLLKAIQTGQPLPIVASGLRLADRLDPQNLQLSVASNVAGGVLSLLSLDNALKNGDTAAAITAGAQMLNYGVTAYTDYLTSQFGGDEIGAIAAGNGEIFQFASDLGGALPFIGMANDIIHGDLTALAIDIIAYCVPVVGQIIAVFQIVSSLFGGDEPDPWGSGRYVWNGTGITVSSDGEVGGNEAVSGFMNHILASMNSMIAQVQQQNPGSALGLIPNRMPSMGYGTDGFHFTAIDPLTGAEKHPGLRYDTNGKPYNAPAGSPESFQSLGEAFIYSALARQAIAPMWEVQTASIQNQYGDPQAGLSEEERAGATGHLAPPPSGTTQAFRPVVLDLNGDGIHKTSKEQSGVGFDVDDSGFLKGTAWIGNDDAFLALDRNYNGHVDSGKELFSNGTVSLDKRGLAGMSWVDSNYDGRLNAADPVFNELRLWRDANQDGAVDAGEQTTLAQNGVTSLNFEMGTFDQNGEVKQMTSPNLEADTEGTRASIVPEGILIQSSNGTTSLLVTRVDDLTQVEANRDGLHGYEDTELIVNSADLLANDTFGGFAGRDLSLTSVQNVRHGTAFVDANHFIHFRPDASYSGSGAGFDYVITASNGQQGTARVDIDLQNVNDAPTISAVSHIPRPIYGYTATVSDESGTYMGTAIYAPYDVEVWDESGVLLSVEHHNTPIAYDDPGLGRVIATDPDDPANSLTYRVLNQPQFGEATVDGSGNFHYTPWVAPNVTSQPHHQGDEERQDAFVVQVTDPHGATVNQTVYVTHYGPYVPPTPPGGDGGCFPIVIDLDHNGFSFTPVDDSNVFFDINSDGWKRKVSWASAGDGLLVFDANGNGKADDGSEIALAKYKVGAQSDLEGLAAFDSNGDGAFSQLDDKWGKFGVWQDANQNGVTDEGEYKALDQLGVASIGLTSNKQFSVVDGNTIQGITTVTMIDGSTLDAADVTIAYANDVQMPQPGGTTQVVSASPFSPSGAAINGSDGNDLILGKTGNTVITTGDGNDVVFAGDGNDFIKAGTGNNVVYAGGGSDVVTMGTGNNVVYAGLGGDVILGGDGHNALFGEGGNDVIMSGKGNDLLDGGAGNDLLYAGDGDDTVAGGSGNDVLFGGNGEDVLTAGSGHDRLDGGAGNDVLDGGAGADDMYGVAGDDTYAVDNAGDTVVEAVNEGIDTVRTGISYSLGANLENLTLTGPGTLSGTGNELDNLLVGNSANNILAGGAGNDTLNGGLGADTMMGGSGDDVYVVDNAGDTVLENADEGVDTVHATISYALGANVENLTLNGRSSINGTGNALANELTGNIADNVLDGGAGADAMAGGNGSDTYIVDHAGDQVIEATGEGIDTVHSAVDYTLSANVENLVLSGAAGRGMGNALDNVLIGTGGDNLLDGGVGADRMSGGAGNDTYVVDNTSDVVIDDANEGIDTVLASVSTTLWNNVENLTLTGNGALNGTGNNLNNVMTGNGANNVLDGGTGADTLAGGQGDDTYVIDDAGDQVAEHVNEGTDTVVSSIDYALGANVEQLTLTDAATQGTGNELNNVLVANNLGNRLAGGIGNDTLFGGAGNDLLDGGTGADSIAGGDGNDSYLVDHAGDSVIESLFGGNDSVFAAIDYVLPEHVENLILTGTADLNGTGNALDNFLNGNAANNMLDGGAGADTMTGGQGDDVYIVDNAADTVVENIGEGLDTVMAGVNYTLSANVETLVLTGSASRGTGNDLNNTIIANDLGNSLYGGAGNDTLTGGTGNDVLDGGNGADAMAGGNGDDVYVVDDGGDSVSERIGGDIDTVLSGINYVLGDNFENLTLTGTATQGTGNELNNVLTANGLGNILSGAAGKDTLHGGAGNDLLDGGTDADTMAGGKGDDIYIVDHAGDQVVENTDEGIDLVRSSVDYTLTANVEHLTLTGAATAGAGNELDNVLTANELGNTLVGAAGNDTLHGGMGNDVLDGGTGVDTMAGGKGNDTYIVDNAGDRVLENADAGIDLVQSSVNYTLTAHAEKLTLTGTSDLNGTGNTLDNALTGNIGNNILDGGAGNDLMDGGAGHDTIFGGTGNDTLAGRMGNDSLSGGSGDDTYLYDQGDGLDKIADVGGTDTVKFGAGLFRDNVTLRLTVKNDIVTANVRILDANGCEQPDQGFDFVVDKVAACGSDRDGDKHDGDDDKRGKYELVSPIETFEFADGSKASWSDLLIKKQVTVGIRGNASITTGRNDDIIYAGPNPHNTVHAGTGHDIVFANSADSRRGQITGDSIFGEGGDDLLVGGSGNDTLDGGYGVDLLFGDSGNDALVDAGGNSALWGADGNDTIASGSDADFIAGGRGDDVINTGAGANVVAFNRNDGNDTVTATAGARNTLSLGDGIRNRDLNLCKVGNDLVLETDRTNQITFKDWYASTANRNFVTLQMIEEASGADKSRGNDKLPKNRIAEFDFQKLVNQFDSARSATPTLTRWAVMNGMLDAYLSGSDTAAFGGDLAYEYGTNGGTSDVLGSARSTLRQPGFGSQVQTIHTDGKGFER